jgi:hypothetical protein
VSRPLINRPANRAPDGAGEAFAALVAAIADLQQHVASELAAQREILGRIMEVLEATPRGRLRAGDAALLDAIAAHVGVGIAFSSRELWHHADRVDDALRAAIGAAGVSDIRALGRRLQRLGRLAPGPVHLVSVGRDAGGRWWTVVIDRQDSHSRHAGRLPA